MLRTLSLMLAAAGAIAFTPASAQTSTGYGSYNLSTVRDCSTTAATALCDGSGPGQQTRQRQSVGGPGTQIDTSFASTGQYAGASTTANVAFGDFGLPTVRGTVTASATNRVGNNIFFWQSYRYDGTEDADIALLGNLHIVNSSGNAQNGSLPGGTITFAAISIWDAADWPVLGSLTDIENHSGFFSYGCNSEGFGPRTYGSAGGSLPGGETNVSVSDQSCYGEQTVTLSHGDEFVIAGVVQFIANRGGWIDASHSFTLGLDEAAIGAANVAALQGGLTPASPLSAVPEPATWAMMLLGFGAIGAGLRRRRSPTLAMA